MFISLWGKSFDNKQGQKFYQYSKLQQHALSEIFFASSFLSASWNFRAECQLLPNTNTPQMTWEITSYDDWLDKSVNQMFGN